MGAAVAGGDSQRLGEAGGKVGELFPLGGGGTFYQKTLTVRFVGHVVAHGGAKQRGAIAGVGTGPDDTAAADVALRGLEQTNGAVEGIVVAVLAGAVTWKL